jgi:hypothetical protein
MKGTKPSGKMKKLVHRIVGEDPSLDRSLGMPAWIPATPLLRGPSFYLNDPLYKLEVLASVLNDVPPDSLDREIADLIEKLVTTPPAKQEWTQQKELAYIIGPRSCIPASDSPFDVLNKFLETNPCVLQIKGLERADGDIHICASHVPIKACCERDRVLWVLWEVFYLHIDLARLKTCPICHKWFVDHSKNKSKTRCSARCTSQRWSWEARKKAGHNLPGTKRPKGDKHAKGRY